MKLAAILSLLFLIPPSDGFSRVLDMYGCFTSFPQTHSPVFQTWTAYLPHSNKQVCQCLGQVWRVHLIPSDRFTSISDLKQVHKCLGHVLWVHLILSDRFTIVLDMYSGFTSFCPTGSPLSRTCTVGSPHSVRPIHHCLGHVLWVHLEAGDGNLALRFVCFLEHLIFQFRGHCIV